MIKIVKKIFCCLLLIVSFGTTFSFAQTFTELHKKLDIKQDDLDNIPLLITSDSLKPIFYTQQEGYTTNPATPTTTKLYGCKADFNDDEKTDYAIVVNNIRIKQDQLVAFITERDTIFALQTFKPLKEIAREKPTSNLLEAPTCYEKSNTGKFVGLEKVEYDMPGDLIRFGWYSWIWDRKNGFKEIVTSD